MGKRCNFEKNHTTELKEYLFSRPLFLSFIKVQNRSFFDAMSLTGRARRMQSTELRVLFSRIHEGFIRLIIFEFDVAFYEWVIWNNL